MKKLLPLITALTLLSSPLYAETNGDQAAFDSAQRIFENNLAGDKDSNSAVIEKFEQLVNESPDQPLYLAYLGSAYTLKARDAFAPWTRLKYVEKGLAMIDKALIMLEPKHDEMRIRGSIVSMETRLVAISTFLKVPGFLHRLQPARDLIKETLASPAFAKAPPMVRGRIYLNAADAAKKAGNAAEAIALLKQAEALLPDSRFKQEAHSRLLNLQS